MPHHEVDGPTELVYAGGFALRVMRVEALLKFRLVGYKYWGVTSYAQQAIDVLAALGGEYDEALLLALLRPERAEDAYHALLPLARSDVPITEERLEAVHAALMARSPSQPPRSDDPSASRRV